MSNDVVFRRIRGRLVPIRLTKSQKEKAKGAAYAVAGATIAATGGKVYKTTVVKSASLSFKGFNKLDKMLRGSGPAQLSLFDVGKTSKAVRSAEMSLQAGKKLSSLSKSIRIGSTGLGAALIGFGAAKAINAMTKAERKSVSPELVAGGTAALTAIAPAAWEASKKSFNAGLANKQTAMAFGKSTLAQNAPKLKGWALNILKARF